jgi:hypothetical protein
MWANVARGWMLLGCSLLLWPAGVSLGQTSYSADSDTESDQRIEQALARRGSVQFVEIPLHKVAASLGQQFDVQILLAAKKLEEASVSQDTPITKKLDDLTLEAILRLILKDLELCIVVRDEVLQVTTPEDAESQLRTRVYPVLDLVAVSAKGGRKGNPAGARDYDALIEVICGSNQSDSWGSVGGPGSIQSLDNAGSLVISQTRDVHSSIERLLTTLRRVKTMQGLAAGEGEAESRK